MLISRNITQDKRVITYFRHLNVRIVKNNLAYSLVRDTFSVFSNSKCKILFSIRFEGCLSFIKAFKRFKKILQYITHILEVHHTYIRECLWD